MSESSPLPASFLAKLERLRLMTRRRHMGRFSARMRSNKMGRGMEFAGYRAYSPGDDFKDVDWTLFARLERYYVRQAHEETELDITLLVDVSASMTSGSPSKGKIAMELATAMAYLGLARLDSVRIVPFAGELLPPRPLPRRKSAAVTVYRYLEDLYAKAPNDPRCKASDLKRAAAQLTAVTRDRGLVVVVSDFLFDDGWMEGLRLLASARFEPSVVRVSSPQEVDPAFLERGGEVILRDLESGERLRVEVDAALRRRYHAGTSEFDQAMHRYARDHGMAYSPIVSDQPLDEAVFEALRLGGVVA